MHGAPRLPRAVALPAHVDDEAYDQLTERVGFVERAFSQQVAMSLVCLLSRFAFEQAENHGFLSFDFDGRDVPFRLADFRRRAASGEQ